MSDANHGQAGSGRPSEADQETFAQDASFNIVQEKLTADADARMVVARMGWITAAIFLLAFLTMVIIHVRASMAWATARLPFVWANAQGTLSLVSNATVNATWESLPDSVVQGQLRQYLEYRYGCSDYHVQNYWGPFTQYWLTPAQTGDFIREMNPLYKQLKNEGLWRKITVRVIQFEKKTPVDGGGSRYQARVEYLASDMQAEDPEPKRMQLYKVLVDFSVGTAPGVYSPDELVLWSQNNQAHFRLYEAYRSAPIEVPVGVPAAPAAVPGSAPEVRAQDGALLPPPPPPAR